MVLRSDPIQSYIRTMARLPETLPVPDADSPGTSRNRPSSVPERYFVGSPGGNGGNGGNGGFPGGKGKGFGGNGGDAGNGGPPGFQTESNNGNTIQQLTAMMVTMQETISNLTAQLEALKKPLEKD